MLFIPFRVVPPDIDESAKKGEDATTLVERLASEKAQVVGQQEARALIIGSDQVAVYAGQIVGNDKNMRHPAPRSSFATFRSTSGFVA